MSDHPRIAGKTGAHAAVAVVAAALLSACGQTGKLYLPEPAGEVVTRPTQTPPTESGSSSSSPQTVDSPPAPASPTPEVTEPEGAKKDKKEGARPPPDSTPKK